MVEKAGVLVRKAIMVLPPDVRAEQVVKRRNRPPPRDVVADSQPLGMLVEHRIDNVDERFIAGEESMPTREQVSFQPPLTLMLAEHLHDATVRAEMVIFRINVGHVAAVGHL